MKRIVGAHGARETPVTMPNTVVKPSSGYNTWPIKAWENSTVPNYIKNLRIGGFLLFIRTCYFPDYFLNRRSPRKIKIIWGQSHGAKLYK